MNKYFIAKLTMFKTLTTSKMNLAKRKVFKIIMAKATMGRLTIVLN
jgi:hypothetical protein